LWARRRKSSGRSLSALFALPDDATGAILFQGRIADPR